MFAPSIDRCIHAICTNETNKQTNTTNPSPPLVAKPTPPHHHHHDHHMHIHHNRHALNTGRAPFPLYIEERGSSRFSEGPTTTTTTTEWTGPAMPGYIAQQTGKRKEKKTTSSFLSLFHLKLYRYLHARPCTYTRQETGRPVTPCSLPATHTSYTHTKPRTHSLWSPPL